MPHPPPFLFEKAVRGGEEARRLGQWGERLVAEDLRSKGWIVEAVNYRCRMGELDLVVRDGRYIVFVEVKLRKNGQFGAACEAVTLAKQRKLRMAAQLYLLQHPTELQPRFDVAEVYAPQGARTQHPDIGYIENAF